ncbi:MAG: SDR family oxidoreductase [Mucilaginibacter polytrichastri]|nr:SDR family oxidoreductase [Mucilaginibacter polytrichastri]
MSALFSLKGKAVLITGATGVLGEGFVRAVAHAGGNVGILGRNAEVAERRAQEVNAAGGRALALVADVLSEEALIAARNRMLDTFGQIDGLVNAAGGNIPEGVIDPSADLFDLNMDGLRRVLDVNLMGSILPTQIFGKTMAGKGGSIINISSMTAQRAITKVLGYTLAKTAIDGYTRWFANELANRFGDTIRMNAIAPGFFLTEQNRNLLTQPDGSYTARGEAVIRQTPFKRFGDPDELSGALIWLLSDASKFVTGTVVTVDGGFIMNSGV